MEKKPWDITCTKSDFEKIKSDDDFLRLLGLARLVNALRFCQKAEIDSKGDRNPSNARSTINSFLFASSVLHEGFLLVAKLGQYYNKLDSFKNGFGKLLRDKQVQTLRNSVLKRARNKFVFHFDKDVAKESLRNFDVPVINFASGVGKSTGEMYFGLADELSINYLLQAKKNESDDSLRKRYNQIVKDTISIMETFSESAEILMADVLEKKGFIVKSK